MKLLINLNKMIKIQFDFSYLYKIFIKILTFLIKDRAYKGYCTWLSTENETPRTFQQFEQFEFWKIHLAFRQYFAWCKGDSFKKDHLCFKSIILNKS